MNQFVKHFQAFRSVAQHKFVFLYLLLAIIYLIEPILWNCEHTIYFENNICNEPSCTVNDIATVSTMCGKF